jgi:hypothetical protein
VLCHSVRPSMRRKFGMLVVGVTAGSNPFSIVVLVASAGILAFGTGPYSYWDPTIPELINWSRRSNKLGRLDQQKS